MDGLNREYDNILIGKQDDFSMDYFIGVEPGGHNEIQAFNCIRYAIEQVCGWDEETAVLKLDDYALKSLHLDGLFKYINFPPELEYGSPRYILHKLYPARVRINFQALTVQTIKDVLDDKRAQFPRDYFMGIDGFRRYCYCIKYIIETYVIFDDIEKIYRYFASPKGNNLLIEKKLRSVTYVYNIDIYDAVYELTKKMPNAELYYNFYKFKREYMKLIEKETGRRPPIGSNIPVLHGEKMEAPSKI